MTERPADWPPDEEPRQCRRWNGKREAWQWKARYETREQAAAKAGKGMALYVCDECGFWHRASVPPVRKVDMRSYDTGKLP